MVSRLQTSRLSASIANASSESYLISPRVSILEGLKRATSPMSSPSASRPVSAASSSITLNARNTTKRRAQKRCFCFALDLGPHTSTTGGRGDQLFSRGRGQRPLPAPHAEAPPPLGKRPLLRLSTRVQTCTHIFVLHHCVPSKVPSCGHTCIHEVRVRWFACCGSVQCSAVQRTAVFMHVRQIHRYIDRSTCSYLRRSSPLLHA